MENRMRTQVVIIWDKPENKYWLTAENIRKALSDYYLGATNFEVEELKNIHGECRPLEAIEIDNNNKNILVEFADEQLKLISEKELDEINESAEEFDGFTGMRVVGRLGKQVSLGDSQPVLLAELEKLMDLLEIPETSKTKMGVKYNRNFLRDYVKKTIVKTKQQALKEIENFCKEEKEDLLKECNIMKDHGILKFNRGAVTALDIIIGDISKQSN